MGITSLSKKGKIITIGIFLSFIYIFYIWCMVKTQDNYSETEKRSLAQKPEFSMEEFMDGKYSTDYEAYVKDQFPERDAFVSMKNSTEILMGKTLLKGVFIGKDGYLIENHGEKTYHTERAEKNANAVISAANRWSETLGDDHVSVMIVPTSQTVMKDKLPSLALVYDQTEYIDTIADGLKDGLLVDVNSVLSNHSDEYIYYKTDHHWTTYGAFLAYREWCESKGLTPYTEDELSITSVTEDFMGTIYNKLNIFTDKDTIEIYEPANITTQAVFNLTEKKDTLFDIACLESRDKYSVFLGGNPGILEITDDKHETVSDKHIGESLNQNKSERILMILKDSYANCFTPMTQGMFDRVYVIDLRFFNMKIDTFVEKYGITDVLLLYNADTLATDVNVSRIK